MKDSDPKKWECPPHTKAKHDILASYLDGWFPVLASWSGRVVFLDGFAGRGRYTDGAEGSPLVALRRLVDHSFFPRLAHREFVFLFVEKDEENARNLQAEITDFQTSYADGHGGWPKNISVHIDHATFDQTAEQIIATLKEQNRRLAPTFAFVDPFGYSGLPMALLAELLSHRSTELFVNFMVGHVQRFIERDGQGPAMESLFGLSWGEILENFDPDHGDRIQHLHNVYAQQLRNRIGFDYVNSFALHNTTGNIGYYLFHGTRSIAGVKLMKAAMWKVDPGGGYTFHDRLAGQDVLFQPQPDLGPLRQAVVSNYRGRNGISIADLEKFTLVSTPYRDTHIRGVLRELEEVGAIEVIGTRARRGTYPADKISINFS